VAKRKSELNRYISLLEKDYLTLLEDHITLRALKIAGIEKMAIYKGIDSIIKDGRIEIHMQPVKKKYR
jgi:predicted nucleotidyltransferase